MVQVCGNPFAFNMGFKAGSTVKQLATFLMLCFANRASNVFWEIAFRHSTFVQAPNRPVMFNFVHLAQDARSTLVGEGHVSRLLFVSLVIFAVRSAAARG